MSNVTEYTFNPPWKTGFFKGLKKLVFVHHPLWDDKLPLAMTITDKIIDLAIRTRKAQKMYYDSNRDTVALQHAKQLEKELDNVLKEYQDNTPIREKLTPGTDFIPPD